MRGRRYQEITSNVILMKLKAAVHTDASVQHV